MSCKDVNECFNEIASYFKSEKTTGHFLIINTENYDVFQNILHRFQADSSKTCLYASDYIFPNGLPDVDKAVFESIKKQNAVLAGVSQAKMLEGASALQQMVSSLLWQSINGKAVVLLDHCEQFIKEQMKSDPRIKRRVVLVEGPVSELPEISFVKEFNSKNGILKDSIKSLLQSLERLSEIESGDSSLFVVRTNVPASSFSNTLYKLKSPMSTFEILVKTYKDVGYAVREEFGTEEQWVFLLRQLENSTSFAALVESRYGSTLGLSDHLWNDALDKNDKWLLWISLKILGEKANLYLTRVIGKSNSFEEFKRLIYLYLAEESFENNDFPLLYEERKQILKKQEINFPLIDEYCYLLGKYEKNEAYYLTDLTEKEKYEFLRCMSCYTYSEKELKAAIGRMSKFLSLYMEDFFFDTSNMILSDSDVDYRRLFSDYFKKYKNQKLTNKLDGDFLKNVDELAQNRPYNKLKSRNILVSQTDRSKTRLYFFDALGVEYLSFILARCEEYGMLVDLSIGRCTLPSITEKNKEFLKYFNGGDYVKIDDLDEIKHHSNKYNYEKCKYPLHLFEELDVIEKAIKNAHAVLMQGYYNQVMFVSDHGASRLAVLYGQEVDCAFCLDNSGEHSGRCCPCDSDPDINFAAYENGFAVFANYERFKGGRRANVEVHGGASLEEVLVPVITMRKKTESVSVQLIENEVVLQPRKDLILKVFSNILLKKPRLLINGVFCEGDVYGDGRHASFVLSHIKRSGLYKAAFYEGDTNYSIELNFEVKKLTQTNTDFNF